MRKRAVICLLTASLVLLFVLGAQAQGREALPAAQAPAGDGRVLLAPQGDALLIVRQDGLYRLEQGQSEQLADFSPQGFDGQQGRLPEGAALIAQGEGLYLLGSAHGPLWRYDQEGARFQQMLPLSPDAAQQGLVYRGFFLFENAIYAIAVDPMNPIPQLMTTAMERLHWQPVKSGIALAAPWEGSQLLTLRDDRLGGGGMALAVLDPHTGSLQDRLPLKGDYRALWTAPEQQAAFLLTQGEARVSRAFGEPKTLLRLPLHLDLRNGAMLPGGEYAYTQEGAVLLITAEELAQAPPALRVLGHTWNLPVSDFGFNNKDLPLTQMDAYPEDTPALTLHMMSGEGAADVYVVYSSQYNLDALLEKGWYYDLGQDEAITQALDRMYPYLQQTLADQGHILAAPFTAQYSSLVCFTNAWEAMGLQEADYPRDYPGLLDFIDRWHEELADRYPDLSLFGQGAESQVYKSVLLRNILTDWRLAQTAQGQPVRFEPLRALIERLLQADFSRIGESALLEDNFGIQGRVFFPGHQVFIGPAGEPADFIPLSVLPGTPAVTSAEAMLLLVNPHTQNAEAALRFVRYVLENMPAEVQPFLYPDANQPVALGMDLSPYQDSMAALEKRIAQTEGAEKRELEAQLDRTRADFEDQMQHVWLVSPEGLRALRAIDGTFVLRQANEYPGAGVGAENNIRRLLDGQISLDQFIHEADQAEKLREAEDGRQ